MKQVIYDKSGRVRISDVPVPDISDHEVLVKNSFSVISAGTEKSMIGLMKKPLWKMALDRPDLAKQVIDFAKRSGVKKTMDLVRSRLDVWHLLGYSSSGTVVKAGKNAEGFNVGDNVACIGSGFANHAEYVAVPKNLVAKIPKGVSLEHASFTGIGCIALQSIRQLKPQLGENIVVIGLGLIGQMVAQMLRANGCNVIGIDLDKTKTTKAYIDEGITKDSVNSVMKATRGIGADGVIIAAATKHNLVNDSFDMCRKKGRVVLLGVCGLDIDRQKMFEKELDFRISTAFGAGSFDVLYDQMGIDYPVEYVRWTSNRNMTAVLDLIATGKLDLTAMQNKHYMIDDAKKAYDLLYEGKLVSALLKYDPEAPKQTIEVSRNFRKKKINVGIIGAGQFVKGFILPEMKKISDFSVYAIATKQGHNSRKLAEEFRAKYASTSYRDIINDKNVDLVVIGTRHDLHARIAIEALKKKKHVFCEKPVAIDKKEFAELARVISDSKQIYACGFNRRYSPAILAIKSDLASDRPMIINYVFNNSYLPKDHWVNIPKVGGGRVIGEACHVIDLFNFLTGSKPVTIQSSFLSSAKGQSNDDNNVAAVIKYHDGSICTMTYSCIGNNKAERERCTVMQDGVVFEMDGFGKVRKNNRIIYNDKADEGHGNEISELHKKIIGKESSLITADECMLATRSTFDIVRK